MKAYGAEFVGTFWLVLGGCGSAVLAAAFPEVGIGLHGVSLAFGLTVLTMAYAIGHISGCHLNPAVSVGLWAGGRFPASQLLPYIAAQVLGAGDVAFIVSPSGRKDELLADFEARAELPPPETRSYAGHKLVWHTGGWPGQVSRLTLVPGKKLGVIVLTSAELGVAFNAVTYRALDMMLGREGNDWLKAYTAAYAKSQADADTWSAPARSHVLADFNPQEDELALILPPASALAQRAGLSV